MNTKRKKFKRMYSIWPLFLAVITFVMTISFPVYAEGTQIIGTVVHEGNIYVYIRGISEAKSDSVIQIGNAICPSEQIAVAKFSDLGMSIRTIVLIDNSKSIPDKNHADIQEILSGIISDSVENEQFKIGTISNEITWQCDYTSNHETLNSVIDELVYSDQDTYLSDILYEVISELRQENTYACTRILVISDGADDKSIGYTNEEVRSLIEENAYLVYSVGIPAKNNFKELETMFSFSRASKARYFLLDGNVSNEEIVNKLLLDQSGICLKITPDESLKDGNSKNILLKLNTSEGSIELVTHAEMPFGTGITEPEKKEEEEKISTEEGLPTLSVSSSREAEKRENAESFPWIALGMGAAIVLILGTLIFALRKKKTFAEKDEKKDEDNLPRKSTVPSKKTAETQIAASGTDDDGAEGLWTGHYLILKNLDNPNLVYKVPIQDEIHIGREYGKILIDDDEVSRKHCVIILRGDLLYIKDTGTNDRGSQNGTYYEGVRVYEETPIVSGGKIKIGRCNYRVDLVEE